MIPSIYLLYYDPAEYETGIYNITLYPEILLFIAFF